MTTTTSRPTAARSAAWRSIERDHRYHRPDVTASASGPDSLDPPALARLSTFGPMKPSSAGSRVSEASIVSATVTVAATATP